MILGCYSPRTGAAWYNRGMAHLRRPRNPMSPPSGRTADLQPPEQWERSASDLPRGPPRQYALGRIFVLERSTVVPEPEPASTERDVQVTQAPVERAPAPRRERVKKVKPQVIKTAPISKPKRLIEP
jgi:hypothetical protein